MNASLPANSLSQLIALAKLGVHFSICDRASHNISRSLARRYDGKPDEIFFAGYSFD